MVALEEKDFILHPICVVPPERHYNSCKELNDDLEWYEKSRAYFYKLHPEFKPKEGLFEQVKLAGRKGFILLPTQSIRNKKSLTLDADDKIYAKWYEDGNVVPRVRSFQVPDNFKPQLKRIR